MRPIAFVFFFGGIGSVLRHLANLAILRMTGIAFPWGILIINIVGCALIGFFARAIPLNAAWGGDMRLALMTGLCGGFTTFSAFSLDAANLWMRGEPMLAIGYVGASVVLCLIGVALGLAAGNLVA